MSAPITSQPSKTDEKSNDQTASDPEGLPKNNIISRFCCLPIAVCVNNCAECTLDCVCCRDDENQGIEKQKKPIDDGIDNSVQVTGDDMTEVSFPNKGNSEPNNTSHDSKSGPYALGHQNPGHPGSGHDGSGHQDSGHHGLGHHDPGQHGSGHHDHGGDSGWGDSGGGDCGD